LGRLVGCDCPGCPPGTYECQLAGTIDILDYYDQYVGVSGWWVDDGWWCQYIAVESIEAIVEDPVCGDANKSGGIDVDDAVYLINFIFSGGPSPSPMELGDVDCSGMIDIDDVVYLISFVFSGGNEPCDVDGDGVPDC
jgi:hypothetical protein